MMGTGIAEGEDRAVEAARRGDLEPAARGRVGQRRARRHHQRHRRAGPVAGRGERGVDDRPGSGRRGRQHHLRRRRRSDAGGQGQDHRSSPPASARRRAMRPMVDRGADAGGHDPVRRATRARGRSREPPLSVAVSADDDCDAVRTSSCRSVPRRIGRSRPRRLDARGADAAECRSPAPLRRAGVPATAGGLSPAGPRRSRW